MVGVVGSRIFLVIVSGILGLIAATWPARRAADLDVLAALTASVAVVAAARAGVGYGSG